MASWVVGDIHGCADELSELMDELALGVNDRLLCVGDLFHRGPDACGVMELLREAEARFILGNHEHAVLERCGLAPELVAEPRGASGLSTSTPAPSLPAPSLEDLVGDGRRAITAPEERAGELLAFLLEHSGYYLEHTDVLDAGPTADGRAWCVVHGGRTPGREAGESRVEDLIYAARLSRRRRRFWFEGYTGPKLVLYGHLPDGEPRKSFHEGRLVALGLDTGCVYGGKLTAYSPELERFVSVDAHRRYASFH